jgi:23S rRNA A1618 N6-methylase RlmF
MSTSLDSPGAGYHIYGVCARDSGRMFIDYVGEAVEAHEQALLDRLSHSEAAPVRTLCQSVSSGADLFELEYVDTQTAAQESVAFWKEYLRALGETIVESGYVLDRWDERVSQRP